MQKNPNDIAIFLVVVSGLIIFMAAFILFILYLYRKKQQGFEKDVLQIKEDHEKTVLNTQLEIQEQTFQHISREIHDNITLSLTLAKLHLHTLDWNDRKASGEKVDNSITLLTNSISQLSDISKGLNTNIIVQQGLLKAIDDELQRIRLTGLFRIDYELTGTTVYMDNQKELIIFRIIQESFNNIIKHAEADNARLELNYNTENLMVTITDDGMGFDSNLPGESHRAGMRNMEARVKAIKGVMQINSQPGKGTVLSFNIPID